MKQTIIHVGLDVDDTQYHDSALDKRTGEGFMDRILDQFGRRLNTSL